MFLEKLRLYAVGDELVKKGFFMSDAEDADTRAGGYSATTERLNSLWEAALADATEARSFDRLCEHLAVDPAHLPDLPKPVSWRFSMMPYGRDSFTHRLDCHPQKELSFDRTRINPIATD